MGQIPRSTERISSFVLKFNNRRHSISHINLFVDDNYYISAKGIFLYLWCLSTIMLPSQLFSDSPFYQLGWGSRCNISEGNAAWYGVGVNRWPIGNHPCFMLYRLARSPLTQRDWIVKDCFGLVRSAISAQAQSLLLCPALSYSALSWGHHEKVGAQ